MNIIELAEQAGLAYKRLDGHYWIDAGYPDIHLERFAELVAAAERELCAKLCESPIATQYGKALANAIRARGTK